MVNELEHRLALELSAITLDELHTCADQLTTAENRLARLEAALRDVGQAAADGADALAMHDPITRSRLAIQGRFEAIADLAQAALQEDSHDG